MICSYVSWLKVLGHGPQARRVDDADVAAAGLDETALSEVLQNGIDGLTCKTHEVAEIRLGAPEGQQNALVVGDAVIRSQIEQCVCDSRLGALAKEFLDSCAEPLQPQAHYFRDLVAKRRRLLSHPQQQVATQGAQHDIFMGRGDMVAR